MIAIQIFSKKHFFLINLDQLGHNSQPATFRINTTNTSYYPILWQITEEDGYNNTYENKNYKVKIKHNQSNGTVDCMPYTYDYNKIGWPCGPVVDVDYINFCKDSFTMYHQSGFNHTIGDTMDIIEQDDINATVDIIWNVTKYFIIDPNCWFEGDISYISIDSDNDGDTLNDSIKATFTVNTSIPQDKIMVKANLTKQPSGTVSQTKIQKYIVTNEGTECEISVMIPPDETNGTYKLNLELYNSTGMVNDLTEIEENKYNDTDISDSSYTLYHPFGHPIVGGSYFTLENRITGSNFSSAYGGEVDNITVYAYFPTSIPPKNSICMIYRANDSKYLAKTEERQVGTEVGGDWITYEFNGTKPILQKYTDYVFVCWADGGSIYQTSYKDQRGKNQSLLYNISNIPDPSTFNTEYELYSIYCSYTPDNKNPEISSVSCTPELEGLGQNITINADVTDDLGVSNVEVEIQKPSSGGSPETPSRYTMSLKSGNTYEYIFNATWLVGLYNYTIHATDSTGNSH